ncbi:MAG: hypothetical protein EOM25_14570 [Deltaproteobacteria bacterium]|nr:hypothetical protein [Deltaproteobacteria bacterium]
MVDSLSNGSAAMSLAQSSFDAQLVTKTLDRMNAPANVSQNQNALDYEFQKDVLSAAFTGKGGNLNASV